MFDKDLHKGKLALVTGASRGIGRATAIALARNGAVVIGTATSDQGAERISGFFKEHDLNGVGMKLDVTQPSSIDSLFAELNKQYQMPNILVNNAAITQDNLFMRMKDDEWLKVMETNLNSVYRLSKACIRAMVKARWGRIINIGSVVGDTGNPGQTNYSAAKAAVVGFSKSLALEVGSRSITVNTISPGFVETDMTQALSEEQRNAIFQRIPMQKFGQVDDIAAAVVFLSSPAASYITGQTLHVNGGMYMN